MCTCGGSRGVIRGSLAVMILLVRFPRTIANKVRAGQPWTHWAEAPPGWPRHASVWTCPKPADAVLVWAGKGDKRKVVLACMEIRNRNEMQDARLLVVISRHQMDIGNEVRGIVDAGFLMMPFCEDDLRQGLTGLCSSNSIGGA